MYQKTLSYRIVKANCKQIQNEAISIKCNDLPPSADHSRVSLLLALPYPSEIRTTSAGAVDPLSQGLACISALHNHSSAASVTLLFFVMHPPHYWHWA